MIKISQDFNKQIYQKVLIIWEETGIANPERHDTYDNIIATLDKNAFFLTAYYDGILVGTCWLTSDYRRLYLHHMAVLPEYQNRGIAKSLLCKAKEISKDVNLQLKLEVNDKNTIAKGIYLKNGFKVLENYVTMIRREV